MSCDPFCKSEITARLVGLRREMKSQRLDGMLVSAPADVRYLSGFTGDSSVLLITRTAQLLITDFRFEEEAADSAPLMKLLVHSRGLMDLVGKTVRRRKLKRLGCQENHLTIAQLEALGGKKLAPSGDIINCLRSIKSPAEIATMRVAIAAAEKGMKAMRRIIKPGMDENRLATELRYSMVKSYGAQDQAFPAIIAEGSRGSLPHAQPAGKLLKSNSLLLFDWGARCDYYHSDLTRVMALGRIPRLFKEVVKIVREAQLTAIDRIKPGVGFRDIDAAARTIIARAGYGDNFGHSLGHGLGLEVHEYPSVGPRSQGQLEPGMVFTVEPGIYLPGRFGVRLEDDVLVTATGCEVLSTLDHNVRL